MGISRISTATGGRNTWWMGWVTVVFVVPCCMNKPSKIVLLADDDEDDRLFLTEALLKVDGDIKIIEAENGVELVNLLEKREFEGDLALIVLDMNMPLMTGIETLKLLKSKPQVSEIPAVMLSTASDTKSCEEATKAGFLEYFIKPHMVNGFLTLAATLKSRYLK